MIIYKITNLITGKIYIGQTIQPLYKRWHGHKGSKRTSPLNSSIQKHGHWNFRIEPICSVLSLEHLDELEVQLIQYYDCVYPNGYNLASGGTIGRASVGKSPWNKGKAATDQARLNQSLSHLGQVAWNKGGTATEESRQKMSAAKIGKRINPETEFKKGAPSAFKGRQHDPASLAKISKNNKMAIPIICDQTGEEFPNIVSAVAHFGIDKTSLQELVKSGKPHRRTGLSFRRKSTR